MDDVWKDLERVRGDELQLNLTVEEVYALIEALPEQHEVDQVPPLRSLVEKLRGELRHKAAGEQS